MDILYDAIIDGIIFSVISIPFILINILLIRAINGYQMSFFVYILMFGLVFSIVFAFGITCYSDLHYDTFDINNILSKDNLNLEFLSTILQFFIMSLSGNIRAVLNLYGNIALFIPIGFFIGAITINNRKFIKIRATIVCCFISLFIELFQVVFNRVGDVNDLLLNSFGGFMGCSLFLFVNDIFDVEKKVIKINLSMFKRIMLVILSSVVWTIFVNVIYILKINTA